MDKSEYEKVLKKNEKLKKEIDKLEEELEEYKKHLSKNEKEKEKLRTKLDVSDRQQRELEEKNRELISIIKIIDPEYNKELTFQEQLNQMMRLVENREKIVEKPKNIAVIQKNREERVERYKSEIDKMPDIKTLHLTEVAAMLKISKKTLYNLELNKYINDKK